MKTLLIKLDDREITLQKLPIGEYPEILRSIKELPKHLSSIENLNVDQLLNELPIIAGDCMPDLVNVIALAAKIPADEVQEMGLADITKLIEGIFKINNFAFIGETLKKYIARRNLAQVQKAESSIKEIIEQKS